MEKRKATQKQPESSIFPAVVARLPSAVGWTEVSEGHGAAGAARDFFLSFFFLFFLIAQKERHEDLTAEDNRGIRRVFPQIDGGAADDTEAGDDFRFSSKWSAWRWNQRKSYFRNEEGRGVR